MKIGILTDSTSDLSSELVSKYEIEIIPLSVNFGEKIYIDGVEITNDEFFEKIENAEQLPGTAQPPLQLFIDKYEEMSKKYDAIISLHVSGSLSGTYNTACLAAEQLAELAIYPVDTSSISLGLGFLTIIAAKMAEKNNKVDQIVDSIKNIKDKLLLYFTVEDLKFMEQGGRIGKASALLGSLLKINPIIEISTETGEVAVLDKKRGKTRTMKRMVNIALEKLKGEEFAWLGFAHGNRKDDMKEFKSKLLAKIKDELNIQQQTFEARISPTLGCHVGPSVYACFILTGDFLQDI